MNIMTLNNVLIAVVSFLAGYAVDLGYLKIRGHRIIVPYISATSRNITIAGIALALVSLGTVLNVSHSANETERCNTQFRAALKYNTEVTAEQRDLSARATRISADRREILDRMFVDIGATIADDPKRIPGIIATYNVRARDLGREYDELITYRNSLDQKRTPYPEPSCGS